MTILAALFIVAQACFVTGVAVSPGHVFRGYPAGLWLLTTVGCGLALAIHALA